MRILRHEPHRWQAVVPEVVPSEVTVPENSAATEGRITSIPTKAIVALAGSGLLIIAITGFLGYPVNASTPMNLLTGADWLFYKPWLLFAWLCALILTLQFTILRQQPLQKKRRQQQVQTFVVTFVCIALVGIFDLFGQQIINFLSQFFHHGAIFRFISNPWLYTVINFGLILLLALTALRRWLDLRKERQENEQKEQMPSTTDRPGQPVLPKAKQLPETGIVVIGDIVVRALLVLLLSVAVNFRTLKLVIPIPPKQKPPLPVFNECSVALPWNCSASLTFLDLLIALLFLVIGTAAASILTQEEVAARVAKLVNRPKLSEIGFMVADTLREIFTRAFLRVADDQDTNANRYDPFAILRWLGWPSLILAGVVGAAKLARAMQDGLHSHQPGNDLLTLLSHALYHTYYYGWPALAWGLVGVAGPILAAAILLKGERRSVIDKSLGLLRTQGFITLLLCFSYTLALWLIQTFLVVAWGQDSSQPERLHAFDLGGLTLLSLLLLLPFGVLSLFEKTRKTNDATDINDISDTHGANDDNLLEGRAHG